MSQSGPTTSCSDLIGRTVVITGASSGIGAATAIRLAEAGANLILHGRSLSDKLKSVAANAKQISSERSHGSTSTEIEIDFLLADFSTTDNWSEEQWQGFAQQAWDLNGRVDAWVNNAGGDVLTGAWKEKPLPDKLRYLWQVDVATTLMLSRAVGRTFKQRGQAGAIVNIGWDQAAYGMSGESGELFATTKGAVMAMSRSLAQSLAPSIRVNCVAPGWIKTDWGQQTSDYWNQRAKLESLQNRWGTPEDVADAIAFLCSDQSRFINGQVLPVNGGFRFNQIEQS